MPNHILSDVRSLLGPHIFLGNLFFLQSIFVPVFGSDGPLWSLANEFWYYILFPLAVVTFLPRAKAAHRLICAVLFLLIAWLVWGGILMAFPIWLLGAALFRLKPPSFTPKNAGMIRLMSVVIYALVFFAMSRWRSLPGFINDYLLGIFTFILLWVLLSAKERFEPQNLRVRISRELARFSYTLYAVHVPFLVVILSLLAGDTRWSPSARHIATAIVVLICVLIYAYALAFFTEFRTDAIRYRLERFLGIASAPPLLPSNPLTYSESHPKSLSEPLNR